MTNCAFKKQPFPSRRRICSENRAGFQDCLISTLANIDCGCQFSEIARLLNDLRHSCIVIVTESGTGHITLIRLPYHTLLRTPPHKTKPLTHKPAHISRFQGTESGTIITARDPLLLHFIAYLDASHWLIYLPPNCHALFRLIIQTSHNLSRSTSPLPLLHKNTFDRLPYGNTPSYPLLRHLNAHLAPDGAHFVPFTHDPRGNYWSLFHHFPRHYSVVHIPAPLNSPLYAPHALLSLQNRVNSPRGVHIPYSWYYPVIQRNDANGIPCSSPQCHTHP